MAPRNYVLFCLQTALRNSWTNSGYLEKCSMSIARPVRIRKTPSVPARFTVPPVTSKISGRWHSAIWTSFSISAILLPLHQGFAARSTTSCRALFPGQGKAGSFPYFFRTGRHGARLGKDCSCCCPLNLHIKAFWCEAYTPSNSCWRNLYNGNLNLHSSEEN